MSNLFDTLKEQLATADPFSTWYPFIVAALVFLVTTIKTYVSGQYCSNGNLLTDLVCVVTGADGGIGEEICKELAKRKAVICMACKNVENGEKVKKKIIRQFPNTKIFVKHLDLRSFDNVRNFAKAVENEFERVDILINNAGAMFYKYEKTVDKFETNLQINYLGHFLLTHLLVPMLKRSVNGRIINVSAHAHASAQMNIDDPLNIGNLALNTHPRDAFAHSKLAVLMSTRRLASELKTISINCCTPGFVRGTKHGRDNPAMKAKIMLFLWMWIFMKAPVMGAQTIIYLATEQNLKRSGKYYNDCEVTEPSELAKDEDLADKLFTETLRALKIEKFQ